MPPTHRTALRHDPAVRCHTADVVPDCAPGVVRPSTHARRSTDPADVPARDNPVGYRVAMASLRIKSCHLAHSIQQLIGNGLSLNVGDDAQQHEVCQCI